MKFSIVKPDLLKPLSHIYSVVERKNTIPILSNLVIGICVFNVVLDEAQINFFNRKKLLT